MAMRWIVMLSLVLLIGCGPTRTRGTRGIAAKNLAVLEVKQHNAIPGFHINAITFDGDDTYDVDGNRKFYLKPGQHKVSVGYGACIHGPQAWFSPLGDWALFTPKGAATGELSAGSTYTLRGWQKGVGSMAHVLHEIVNADWEPPGTD